MGAARKIDIHGAKGGEDKPQTPTEAPDSLRSVALAKMLIAVGEGSLTVRLQHGISSWMPLQFKTPKAT